MENFDNSNKIKVESIYNLREQGIHYNLSQLPSLVVRIKAFFIDLLILLLVFATASIILDMISNVPSLAKGFIAIFMLYLYDPILTSFTGGTIGHKLMKLKIKQLRNPEKNISLLAAFLRFLIKTVLGWISFFTVTGNVNKRAIHDLASGSIILKK
jgi:uncharacterized RDD family membrane protein YckC